MSVSWDYRSFRACLSKSVAHAATNLKSLTGLPASHNRTAKCSRMRVYGDENGVAYSAAAAARTFRMRSLDRGFAKCKSIRARRDLS